MDADVALNESARGLAYSKTWRKFNGAFNLAELLECGSPLPLSLMRQ